MEPDISQMLPLNPRDYLVLFALTEGERHGYGLVKDIEDQTDGVVKMDPSNLYRSLKRLIGEGWVEERGTRQQDGERRKYYGITGLGRRVVQAEAARLAALAEAARSANLIGREKSA